MKEDRQILLLSGRREHLDDIYKLLQVAGIITVKGLPLTFGYYYGNQGGNKLKHKKMLEDSSKCDVVLGTVAIAAEALDIATLNTEIMATPFADIEQAVGRILRKFHTINPMIIDFVDKCGNFQNQGRTRLKYYKSEGYITSDIDVNLDNDDLDNAVKHITDVKFNVTETGEGAVAEEDEEDDEEEPKKPVIKKVFV